MHTRARHRLRVLVSSVTAYSSEPKHVARVQAVPLAKLMAACLLRPEMAVVEIALDFFNALDYVLMADRDPLLRAPLYRDLLPSLMQHARYPEGFTGWEDHIDDDRDEDSFKRFRFEICRPGSVAKMSDPCWSGSFEAKHRSVVPT